MAPDHISGCFVAKVIFGSSPFRARATKPFSALHLKRTLVNAEKLWVEYFRNSFHQRLSFVASIAGTQTEENQAIVGKTKGTPKGACFASKLRVRIAYERFVAFGVGGCLPDEAGTKRQPMGNAPGRTE
jgi:hypothetical protein